jgi:hypothetical protein
MGNGTGHNGSEENRRLINLNKFEVILGIIVALVTLGNTYGIISVMPYRLTQVEKANAILQTQFEDLKKENASNKELLIRIDERLKIVQEQLQTDRKKQP